MKPITLLALGLAAGVATGADSFYKEPPLFSTAPSETASFQTIDRFGPVGIGIELHQPAFVMKVKNVEEGSPAAATGKLNKGQIIETINGQKLKDIDPRIQLGDIITAAEAADGVVKLVVRDAPEAPPREIVVNIPVLGAYSKTWPLDGPRSDRTVCGIGEIWRRAAMGLLQQIMPGHYRELMDIRDQLVYEYLGNNRDYLLAEAQATRQSSSITTAFDPLAALYRKVGVHDYDWHLSDPNLKDATWDYFTFDPPEQQKYDLSPWRYRK
ncbi:MAG: DUF6288 domain-containing protein [Verrucomicrobia bacterium]|nr:DUF6288 domain-containing protein [Verrucomicrobiota bacterium]